MASRLKTMPPRVSGIKQAANGWAKTTTESTTARGYGWQWQQLRQRILARDCGLCQVCKAEGRVTVATAVDHITPKSRGGNDDPANLRAICEPCHAVKTQRESR